MVVYTQTVFFNFTIVNHILKIFRVGTVKVELYAIKMDQATFTKELAKYKIVRRADFFEVKYKKDRNVVSLNDFGFYY